jgi:hypothetical protein
MKIFCLEAHVLKLYLAGMSFTQDASDAGGRWHQLLQNAVQYASVK